jgi:hypothetical protein
MIRFTKLKRPDWSKAYLPKFYAKLPDGFLHITGVGFAPSVEWRWKGTEAQLKALQVTYPDLEGVPIPDRVTFTEKPPANPSQNTRIFDPSDPAGE